MKEIDARGKPCPEPVLLARRALDAGEREFAVLVDGRDSAENVSRMARSAGCRAAVEESAGGLRVTVTAGEAQFPRIPAPGKVLLIASDRVGAGDDELGRILMMSLLGALAEGERLPARIALLNAGVKLACADSDVLESLRALAGRGVDILACGTCLKYFGLMEKLESGRVSNAYEIMGLLMEEGSVTLTA